MHIPFVFFGSRHFPNDLYTLSKLESMKAMILAAGLGTRFKPWTETHPKALFPVNGKSLLQRNIEYLQAYGITEVIVNVHHFATQIISSIQQNNGWGSKITISNESDLVLETGGGLKKAAWYFNSDSFLVVNADILTNFDLKAFMIAHDQKKPMATLAVTDRKSSRYFLFDEQDILRGWRNVSTGEEKGPVTTMSAQARQQLRQLAFSGIHIIDPRLFQFMNHQGKFSIVDVYLECCATETIRCFDHSASKFVDVGKPEAVAIAESLFR